MVLVLGATRVLGGTETYESPLSMAETARTLGVELTPLETVARGMLGAEAA